jgi:C4-dicarboxylate transporter DctQ subunit
VSTNSEVAEDHSLLSRLDRGLFKLETVFVFIGGLAILGLIFLATANSLGRWLFNAPVMGYVDIIEQAIVFFAVLGVSYAQRLGGHIRMDMLIGRLKGRALWLAEAFTTFCMLLLSIVLTYGSYLHFYRAFSIGDSSLDIELPTWPAKLVVPIALFILSLRLSLQIWAYLRAFKLNKVHPIAVPIREDVATLAIKEAAAVSGAVAEESK